MKGTLNSVRYQEEILATEAVPFYYERPLQIFQQDNASCHSARATMNFLEDAAVVVLPWPARSPDLSPIEHVWDFIGRRLHADYEYPPATVDQLFERLVEQWENITADTLVNLIHSMPDRIKSCITSRGGHTRF